MLKRSKLWKYTSCKKGEEEGCRCFYRLMESQMQNMYKVARSILSRDEDVADAISDTILVAGKR